MQLYEHLRDFIYSGYVIFEIRRNVFVSD